MTSSECISVDISSMRSSRTFLSSVAGFSRPPIQHIRSLIDLLDYVKYFNLDLFDSASLQHSRFIGEGVSYKVARCTHLATRKVYAVKQVKLPQISDSGAFERQVACVVSDIEAMSSLEHNPNILSIIGYGWSSERNLQIPFLVTEYASGGTLRSYLKSVRTRFCWKIRFCEDVCNGLRALHKTGNVHGDLKLDNILVTLGGSSGYKACVSDFGHSLRQFEEYDGSNVKQRYGGTVAYNAPEVLQGHKTNTQELDFRLCDIWSFGLLYWEVMTDGRPYYDNVEIQRMVLEREKAVCTNMLLVTEDYNQALTTFIINEVTFFAPLLLHIASREVKELSGQHFPSSGVPATLKCCLQAEPSERLSDISLLPLVSDQSKNDVDVIMRISSSRSWSFKTFENAFMIPQEARKRILAECQELANKPGDSIAGGRAACLLAFAYAAGFVGPVNLIEANIWAECCARKGLRLMKSYLPCFQATKNTMRDSHESRKLNYFESTRQALITKSSRVACGEMNLDPDVDALSIGLKLYKSGTLPKKHQSTMFVLAYRTGNTDSVSWLQRHSKIARGRPKSQEETPLHWLFMFPDKDIVRVLRRRRARYRDKIFTDESLGELMNVQQNSNVDIRSFSLDPQFPLQLGGTPLSFATTVYCKTAVRLLLETGSNPLVGGSLVSGCDQVREFAAVHIATRFHMPDLLDILLQHICHNFLLTTKGFCQLLKELLKQLAGSTPVERLIIHGPFTENAAKETISVLKKHYLLVGSHFQTSGAFENAVRVADFQLCSVFVDSREPPSSDKINANRELIQLMRTCTETACQVRTDPDTAINILKMGISFGASADGFEHHRPIFIAIAMQNPAVVEWLIDVQHVNLVVFDKEGNTPLHVALTTSPPGTYDITKFIEKGASPDALDSQGRKPIFLVNNDRSIAYFTVLLQSTEADDLHALLVKAVSSHDFKIASAIIQYVKDNSRVQDFRAEVGKVFPDGNTILHECAEIPPLSGESHSKLIAIIKFILSAGGNPCIRNKHGVRPIDVVTAKGNSAFVDAINEYLKEMSKEVAHKDPSHVMFTNLWTIMNSKGIPLHVLRTINEHYKESIVDY